MFAIQITEHDGRSAVLRLYGNTGPVLRYATREVAEREAGMLRDNVGDEFQSIAVVVLRRGMA